MQAIKNIGYWGLLTGILLLLSACMAAPKKVILDSSTDGAKPEWVKNTKVSWEDGPVVRYRATSTIWGDERLDGCYQLARLNAKEALLTEISEDIRGETNHVVEGLSEEAENMLNQLRSATYQGNITGLKFREEYYERYEVKDDVRVQCFVLGEIRKSDYNKVKRRVFNRVTSVDPELKEAIKRKGIRFFDNDKKDKEEAKPGKPIGLDSSVVPVEVSDVAVSE